MSEMQGSRTHVAGHFVGLLGLGRAVQRCCICGEALLDAKLTDEMLNDEESMKEIAFRPSRMLRKTENSLVDIGDFSEDEIPIDICALYLE